MIYLDIDTNSNPLLKSRDESYFFFSKVYFIQNHINHLKNNNLTVIPRLRFIFWLGGGLELKIWKTLVFAFGRGMRWWGCGSGNVSDK